MSSNQRIIHLTEIAAHAVPENNHYRYKCRVDMMSDAGETLLHQDLLGRRQPSWLVELKNPGDCTVAITLCCRDGDITQPWQDIDTVTFATQDYLNGDRNANLEFPVTTWREAPDLKLNVRLTQSTGEGSRSPMDFSKVASRQEGRPVRPSAETGTVELPEAVVLTAPEAVIVKDVWNKLRPWKELQMEKFLKRLLLEEPELDSLFWDVADSISDFFYSLFDCAIHQLQPETQIIVGEPFMGVPPLPESQFKTVEAYGQFFANVGMTAQHWIKARQVWMWMLPSIPYLEDYDREDLKKGEASALYTFFNSHIILPMATAIQSNETILSPEIIQQMAESWLAYRATRQQMGTKFYRTLFERYPMFLPFFGRADMHHLSQHLLQEMDALINCLQRGSREDLLEELHILGEVHTAMDLPSCAYPAMADTMLALLEAYSPQWSPELQRGWKALFERATHVVQLPLLQQEQLLKKAEQFLNLIASEQAWEPGYKEQRWQEIKAEVKATGTYTQTYEELAYGTQVAWRNASKCVGRISWHNMVVRDRRRVTDPDEMFQELREHVRFATNGGNLQITMTVFRPRQPQERWGPRIWNGQLFRYAAYEQPDGTVMGDPANLALTQAIIKLGWQPPEPRSEFDLLPLVIEVPHQAPRLYPWQPDEVLEVPIEHPSIPQFKALGLRWYAIPAVSNFAVHIGGLKYGCIPFNGWYMNTEVMRDFLDPYRYDKTQAIAQALNLDTSSEQTLWRDRVALELNVAILHSFQKAKVTMVDHQTASRQFISHDLREKKAGRECPGDYGWVVPASGGSTCPVWHHQMRDFYLEPAYHYSADPWAVEDGLDLEQITDTRQKSGDRQNRMLLLYGSQTGTAEGFARQAARQLRAFQPQVMAMDDYAMEGLASEKLVLVITSTYGNGEMPSNGQRFLQWLQQQPAGSLDGLKYSVLGIGSTVYEHFCAAGIAVDQALMQAGGDCIVPLHQGDEIKGQAETFNQWLGLISRILGTDRPRGQTTSGHGYALTVTFLDQGSAVSMAASPKKPGTPVPVMANDELLTKAIPGQRSTRRIVFDLTGTPVNYETGDHVAVYPCNPPELVDRLCQRLGVAAETYFTAAYGDAGGNATDDPPPIAVPTTVGQVLTEELDLSLPGDLKQLLAYLHTCAQDGAEQQRLEVWLEILYHRADSPEAMNLQKTFSDNFMTVVDLLDEFPSATVTLAGFLEWLPKLKPRLYSIASCPLLHPGQIQITVSVTGFVTDAGKAGQGLCSNYLANLRPGSRARIRVHPSKFRPPADPQAPLLMVGPGAGVSPLLGILQHREALRNQGKPLGEATLYFGCRNQDDFIYQEQLETWQQQGVLTDLPVAFSRRNDHNVHVQDLMLENAAGLWNLLSHPQCHYYVCGDAKIVDDIFACLMEITKTQGQLSHPESVTFLNKMKQEKRFHADVWGIQLNYKKAIQQIQKDNYSRAEKWLEQVQQSPAATANTAPVSSISQ